MPVLTHLTIATRESPLALWQAEYAKASLLKHWPDLKISLLPMKTSGDKFLNAKLLEIGGKGLFVKELEEALLDKRADLAVHSMKDVPSTLPDGLDLSIIFARQTPLDAFVSHQYKSLDALPKGAVLGTSSLRRAAQALAARPDLQIKPIRGNVGTRLNKLKTDGYDAILLAKAGLVRLNLEAHIQETIPEDLILPAPGQGALGIECRKDDEALKQLLAPLHDENTATCVGAERTINHALGGSCHTPIAIYCRKIKNDNYQLDTRVVMPNGERGIQDTQIGKDPLTLAEKSLNALKTKGINELLHAIQQHQP